MEIYLAGVKCLNVNLSIQLRFPIGKALEFLNIYAPVDYDLCLKMPETNPLN